jgi:hypothetical protein
VTGARGNTTRQLHHRRTASDGRAHRFTGARTKQRQLPAPTKKGSDPFSEGLTASAPHTPRLRTSTSTQENGSRWAAQ